MNTRPGEPDMSASSTFLWAMKVAYDGERTNHTEHKDDTREDIGEAGVNEASMMDSSNTSMADTPDASRSALDQLRDDITTLPSPPRTRSRGQEAAAPKGASFSWKGRKSRKASR